MPGRSIFALIIAVLMITTMSAAHMVRGDTEPNGSKATAEEITPGEYSGEVNIGIDEYDYHKFQAGEGAIINVTFESNATDDVLMLTFTNSADDELFYLESMDNDTVYGEYHTNREDAVDWYYIIVEASGSGNYTFILTLGSQDDAGSGGDAAGTYADAYGVAPGEFSGLVVYEEDDYDVYKFWTGNGSEITVDFTSESTEYELTLYLRDPSETELFYLDSIDSGTVSDSYMTDPGMGWYYIEVEAYGDGIYTILLTIADQNDAGQGADAPSTFPDALTIKPGSFNGTVTSGNDDVDLYRFTAGEGDVINISFIFDDEGDHLILKLYGTDKYEKETITSDGSMMYIRYLTSFDDERDWFYIGVEAYSSGNYSFVLTLTDQDDGGSGGDAPGTTDSDLPTISPSTFTGTAGDMDITDYYNISVSPGDIIRLVVNATGADLKVTLLNETSTLKGFYNVEKDTSFSIRYVVDWSLKGTSWILGIVDADLYRVDFSVIPQDDGGSGTDAPGQPYIDYGMVTDLKAGEYSGYIDVNNDMEDYYRVEARVNETLLIVVMPEASTNTLTASLETESGTYILTKTSYNGVVVELIHTPEITMDVILKIRSSIGFGNYTFRIVYDDIQPPDSVTYPEAYWGGYGVSLSWSPPYDQVPPVTGYKVYRGNNSSDLTLLATITDPYTAYYYDESGVLGTTYIYGIAAYSAGGIGPINETDPVTFQNGIDLQDMDGDGMPNSWEEIYGLNVDDPNDAGGDLDGDGFTNLQEYIQGTNPTVYDEHPGDEDRDFDGMPDAWETQYGLDPDDPFDSASDIDNDGYPALAEYQAGTDPTDVNSVPGTVPVNGDDDEKWYDKIPGGWIGLYACEACGLFMIMILGIPVIVFIKKKGKGKSLDEE